MAPYLCLCIAVGSQGVMVGGFLRPAWTEGLTIANTAALVTVPALLESSKPL